MQQKNFIYILVFLLFALVGCSPHPYYQQFPVVKKGTYCADQNIKLLNKSGISAKRDRNSAFINISIPTNKIFLTHSANFNDHAYQLLDTIADLLNCYEEEDVKVAGNIIYDPNYGNKLTIALATEQAHQVFKYLWSQDINASLVYAEGKIASANTIDISFKKYWRDVDVHYGTE